MTTIIIYIALIAFFWGGWPLVSRSAGETGTTGTLILSGASTATVFLAVLWQGTAMPAAPALLKLLIAGAMIGIGFIAFNIVITNPLVEISVSIPIIDALMILVSVIGGIYFFKESLTVEKIIGITFLCVGVFLLRPSS